MSVQGKKSDLCFHLHFLTLSPYQDTGSLQCRDVAVSFLLLDVFKSFFFSPLQQVFTYVWSQLFSSVMELQKLQMTLNPPKKSKYKVKIKKKIWIECYSCRKVAKCISGIRAETVTFTSRVSQLFLCNLSCCLVLTVEGLIAWSGQLGIKHHIRQCYYLFLDQGFGDICGFKMKIKYTKIWQISIMLSPPKQNFLEFVNLFPGLLNDRR